MPLNLDAFGSLMFLAGFLAALGVVFNVMAALQHLSILRLRRRTESKEPSA